MGRIATGTGVIIGATIASDDVVTALGTLELDLYDDTITAGTVADITIEDVPLEDVIAELFSTAR